MNYYISDLHLFHEAVIRFDNRPFVSLDEMHKAMVEKWNSKVTNGDTVYILGDVSLRGKNEDLIALVATLKGKKVLIRGNHDDISDYNEKQLKMIMEHRLRVLNTQKEKVDLTIPLVTKFIEELDKSVT